MIGFIFKKPGLFSLSISDKIICPSCGKKFSLPLLKKTTKYGYKLNKMFTCSCGYSANFIIKNIRKVESNKTFKRTCKDCGTVWNFTSKDVTLSGYKQMASIGSPFSGNIKESNLNRCEKCGSRNITLELL